METLRATLALMSARLDALAGAVEGARLSYSTVAASLERVERSLSQLTKTMAEADQRSTQTASEVSEALLERLESVGQQMEALRRRIALRGRGDQMSSEEMIELIAGAVAERLVEGRRNAGEPSASPRRRRGGR